MKRLLIVCLMMPLIAAPAFAQSMADKMACRDDAKKFCADVKPGGGRVLDCLAPHKDQLSDSCKQVLASHGK